MEIKSEDPIKYNIANNSDNAVIGEALSIVRKKVIDRNEGYKCISPDSVKHYFQINYISNKDNIFGMLILNNNNKIIDKKIISNGFLKELNIQPKDIIKYVLEKNGNKVIFFHNHCDIDNNPIPSNDDKKIIKQMKSILQYVDITILDYFILGDYIYGFAENELM